MIMDVGDARMFKRSVVRRQMVDVLLSGTKHATLVLKDGLIINVETREIYRADVAVYDKYILKVGNAADVVGENTRVVDLQGKYYVAPGLIDSHMHFESSMLTISEFSRLSIPSGTTTLVADPHEIGNALGPVGMKAMAEETLVVPNKVYLVVPALTPDCPQLETAGYDVAAKDIAEILKYHNVIGIGELQGFSNVKHVYKHTPEIVDDLVASTNYAQSIGKIIDGNAPELFGSELAAHIIVCGGKTSCHETTTKEECLEKLRYGVAVYMREGSTQKNMSECIRVVTENGLDSRLLIGATDDMVAENLAKEGHMNWVVKRIIAEGIDPVEAIQMVTINPANHFGLHDVGALLPGRAADIVVISDLEKMLVEQVYIDGKLAAEHGKMLLSIPKYIYPEGVKNSVKCELVTAEKIRIQVPKTKVKNNKATVRVIGLIPDQNLTESYERELEVQGGTVKPDVKQDILPIIAAERYGRSGNTGKAFVTGFGLAKGAIAESISHDAHNIIAVGTSYEEIALAINRVIAIGGGVVLTDKKQVIGELKLPVGGLITDELDGYALSSKLQEMHDLAKNSLGCKVHSPFMHLSFLALTTSPKWKITDKGLIDVNNFKILPVIVD